MVKFFDNKNEAVSEVKKLCGKYGVSISELSYHMNVLTPRIYEILNGRRSITADSDLRLCKFFKLRKGHFLQKQMEYDLYLKEEELLEKLAKIKTVDEVLFRRD